MKEKEIENATVKNIIDNEEAVDEDEVQYLVINNKRLKQATIRLNKELTRLRNEHTEHTDANNANILML